MHRMHCLRARFVDPSLCSKLSKTSGRRGSLPWRSPLVYRPFTISIARRFEPAQPAVTLRPYQREAIDAVLSHVDRGERRLGISLATGGGKTVIFSHLIGELPLPTPDATQTLILAHTRELVEQAAKHCRNLYPTQRIEIEMAHEHASGNADITVASMKSITSTNRLSKFDPSKFKLLLVDEAHHIAAATYLQVLKHFGLEEKHSKSHLVLLGLSATLSRADGLSLDTAIDHIVYHLDLKDMIKSRYLSDAVFTTVKSNADLSKVTSYENDFQNTSLGRAVNTPAVNKLTVGCWLEHAQDRKSTLVFCVNISHAKSLTEVFRQEGVDARCITSLTNPKERSERLADFRRGEYKVLLNVGVFLEGFDMPNIDCVVLARPTKSSNLLLQMIGRGLRTYPGKSDCLVLDMVASKKTGLVNSPSLFGLDPQDLDRIDAATLALMGEAAMAERQDATVTANEGESLGEVLDGDITMETWDSLLDLINPTADEAAIAQYSPNVWVQISPIYYVLSSTWVKDFVSVRADGHEWAAKMTPSLRFTSAKSPYGKPRHIATAAILEDAIRAADEYAKEKYEVGLRRDEPWRSRPATEKQLGYLRKLLGATEDLTERALTGGQVRNLIVKLLRGSKGLYKKNQVERAKARRAHEKKRQHEETKRKATVKVGPVE